MENKIGMLFFLPIVSNINASQSGDFRFDGLHEIHSAVKFRLLQHSKNMSIKNPGSK